MTLNTSEGKSVDAVLENALYVPSYPQDIFSVQAATEKGATVVFRPYSSELIASDGTKFDIEKRGRLYYLCSNVSLVSHAANLKRWHEILGHCNISDILKLESVLDGMKITDKANFDCDVCTLGKMAQFRNRSPDARASAPLQLVHTDLAGPISPVAKDGFRYAISFIDDYSGVMFLYFLKQKSDAVAATERFLADVALSVRHVATQHSAGWPHVWLDQGYILTPQVCNGVPNRVTLLHSSAEVRAAIELSFNMVSGVTPDIHVLDGVYVSQVEGVNFGVVCPIDPMVSMSC